jgi:hypothetical protein
MDTEAQTNAGDSDQTTTIYRALSSYAFDSDSEYLSGLSAILGHPETAPTQEELSQNPDLILQSRCFYFARKYNLPAIDALAYSRWATQHAPTHNETTQQDQSEAASTTATTAESLGTQPPTTQASTEPPYPNSFAAIVDLITRNVPVPGIEDVPDTVLEHGSSKIDQTPRRRKPWETNAAEAASTDLPTATHDEAEVTDKVTQPLQEITSAVDSGNASSVDAHLATGDGVVKILQPNAIPDSGLLSRD